MIKKILTTITALTLLSIIALGVVSASPNMQTDARSASFEILAAVLADANSKGALSDAMNDLLSDMFIEYFISPHTGETKDQVVERLSVEGQSTFQFLTTTLADADDKGALTDSANDLLSDLLIENLISPYTGESIQQVRERLSMPGSLTPIATSTSIVTPMAATPTATSTLSDMHTQSAGPEISLRHIIQKRYMLLLINIEREKAGVAPVVLGDNTAAQLHAEAAFDNCFSSHWGIDGLKPHMRYSLAGGYQSNSENISGSDYCLRVSDSYRAIDGNDDEIRQAMDGLVGSPGHMANILNKWHKKVNIGLAWDRYNFKVVQHFEGDYVEYDKLPAIENGILTISGRTKNGARFDEARDLSVSIFYDPPPHTLTLGQVSRTYCYGNGLRIALLRRPAPAGSYWPTDEYSATYRPCPDPYDVPADAHGPGSLEEAHQFWEEAKDRSETGQEISIVVPWITALEWTAREESFSVKADLRDTLTERGEGVYTIYVWGKIGEESVPISRYSIFHGIIPPDTYSKEEPTVQDMQLATSTPVIAPTPQPLRSNWNRHENGVYGFSIDTSSGWSLDEDTEDDDFAYIRPTSDRWAGVVVESYDLSTPYSLQELAEWRRDSLIDRARVDESWNIFEITSFVRKRENGKEFYELRYDEQSSIEFCVERVTERIYVSSWYPDKPHGYRVNTGVCEHGLGRYSASANAIQDSFTEWMPYWNAPHAFGLNIAPGWTLETESETDEYAKFRAPDDSGVLEVEVYEVGSSSTLEDFVDWRLDLLGRLGDSWEIYEPTGTFGRGMIGARDEYVITYIAQADSEHCVSGNVELLALSSYQPAHPYGFLVLTSVCQHSLDRHNDDRWEMIESFRY